jgi:NTE family protein
MQLTTDLDRGRFKVILVKFVAACFRSAIASVLFVSCSLACALPIIASELESPPGGSNRQALDGHDAAGSTAGSVTPAARDSSNRHKVKVALVLGGGGTRGASHVGVLKVLEKEKVPFDIVVGTSMGAIVGGFYCAGLKLQEIEKMFLDRSLMRSYMTVPIPVRLVTMPVFLLPRLVYHPYDGLFYGVRFRRYLNQKLPDDEKRIEDLKKPYAAVAVDLTEGLPHAITRGPLAKAMQASSAVPGLRKPVQIGNDLFIDGGVLENIPVEQALELGADIVIAVNCDERLKKVPINSFRKMGSVSRRIITLQLEKMDGPHADKACITLHPEVDGIGLLSTKRRDAVRAIKAGEDAARQALPQIRQCLTDAGINF